MPQRITLTDARVKAIKAPAAGRLTVYDTGVPELAVRITATGSKAWYAVAWFKAKAKQKWVHLGNFPALPVDQARKQCREQLVKLADGIDPIAEAKEERKTEAERHVMLDDVLKRRTAQLIEKGRCEEYRRDIERTAEGFKASSGIDDLLNPQCAIEAEKWVSGLTLSPSSKKRHRANLKSLGIAACRWWPDLMTRNPFAALDAGAVDLVAPEIFTVAECKLLVSEKALAHLWGTIGAVLLYTGARLMEGVHLHWSRIDLSDHVRLIYVVPPTTAERAEGARVKRNRGRAIPIQPELIEILARTPEAERVGYLLPDSLRRRHRAEHRRQFLSWCKLAGVTVGDRHPHSLRHTRACLGLAAGENDLTLRLTLGHTNEAMSAWYAQSAMRMKAQVGHWNGKLKLKEETK